MNIMRFSVGNYTIVILPEKLDLIGFLTVQKNQMNVIVLGLALSDMVSRPSNGKSDEQCKYHASISFHHAMYR